MSDAGRSAMIPITKTVLGTDEQRAVERVLGSGWILQGPEVAAFEQELAAFAGAPGGVAVSSGTAALHLGLMALGIGAGDEVITVSHSFIATANAIRLVGARPVFVDIEPNTLNLDARLLAAALTPRTRALLCVHQLGMPCDLDAIGAFADAHGLPLVEDAACALGSTYGGARIGAPRGALATFSFHPRKILTTGDGGFVTSRNAALLERIRCLRQHGTLDGTTFVEVGFNYRMTDLQAAIGRTQLDRLPALLAERREQVERYRALLIGRQGVVFPVEPEGCRGNWQSLALRLPGLDTRPMVRDLNRQGIGVRGGITNAHEQPAYAGWPHGPLPCSERASVETLMLPLYPGLTDEEQRRVCGSIDGLLPQ